MDVPDGAALKDPMPDRPIRVLHVMEATIGGTKRHLLDLVASLDRRLVEVEIASPRVRSDPHGDTSFFEDMARLGVVIHEIPMVRAIRPTADARTIWALARLIRKRRHHIVHTHSTKAGVLGRVAALLNPNTRAVHTPHGFYFLNFDSPFIQTALRWQEQVLGWISSRVIVLSAGERDIATDLIPDKKIRLIPNAFDSFEPFGRVHARQRLGLPPKVPVVCTTARFTAQKAPFNVADTFAAIHHAHPQTRFVWMNDGELRDPVEARLQALGVNNATLLTGYLSDARALLTAADVYLHLARWEGAPYSVMEAMTAGVPVVAARAVGTTDLIDNGRTGVLVNQGDVRAAAAAVVHLLTHPDEARTLTTNARRAVAIHHNSASMARATEHVYRELIAGQ